MTTPANLGALVLPIFFAQSTIDGVKSSALGEWLVIGAAVLVIIRIGWEFVDRVQGGPTQKSEVTFAAQFATQKEHAELKAEVTKLDSERRTSVANLHAKIDGVAQRLDDRIDAIPARTISLLGETKKLHTR